MRTLWIRLLIRGILLMLRLMPEPEREAFCYRVVSQIQDAAPLKQGVA